MSARVLYGNPDAIRTHYYGSPLTVSVVLMHEPDSWAPGPHALSLEVIVEARGGRPAHYEVQGILCLGGHGPAIFQELMAHPGRSPVWGRIPVREFRSLLCEELEKLLKARVEVETGQIVAAFAPTAQEPHQMQLKMA